MNIYSACIRVWVANITWFRSTPTLKQLVFLPEPIDLSEVETNSFAVPSLTPVGFAHWMTLFILAYPEEEHKRLGKVVMSMPIDADDVIVDGKPERLPKQIVSNQERKSLTLPRAVRHPISRPSFISQSLTFIFIQSRHLLPDKADANSEKLLSNAIFQFLADFGSTNRRRGSLTAPSLSRRSSTRSQARIPVEIHQVRTSPTSSKAQPIERERERKPHAGAPNSECSSNEEGIKIERDRQPYTAQPGSGKVYVEKNNLNLPTRPGRANSTSSRTSVRERSDAGSRVSAREQSDVGEPREPRHQRTQSTTSQTAPPRPVGRRTSSPPLRNFRHSIPDDLQGGGKYGPGPSSSTSSFTPGSYGSNTSFPPPPPGPPPIDIRGERGDRKYREDRQYSRRGTDPEEIRYTGEFNSPKDAEKWDRYQEAVGGDRYNNVPYERGSVSIDPKEMKGAEDFYREKPRPEYDAYGRKIERRV